MPTLQQALEMLKNDPVRFLGTYYLKIVTAGNNLQCTYRFTAYESEEIGGLWRYRRGPQGNEDIGKKSFSMSPGWGPDQPSHFGEISVSVWHVPVVQGSNIDWNNVNRWTRIPREGGPDIVVTTLLNACSFVCLAQEDSVWMMHVQPSGGLTNTDIGDRVMDIHGSYSCNTPYNYDPITTEVTIVGIRRDRIWTVYAQSHPRGPSFVVSDVWVVFSG